MPPFQGSDSLLNPTQGFTLGYFLSPLQGSGVVSCSRVGSDRIWHLKNLTQGFTLGYFLSPLQGSGGRVLQKFHIVKPVTYFREDRSHSEPWVSFAGSLINQEQQGVGQVLAGILDPLEQKLP